MAPLLFSESQQANLLQLLALIVQFLRYLEAFALLKSLVRRMQTIIWWAVYFFDVPFA